MTAACLLASPSLGAAQGGDVEGLVLRSGRPASAAVLYLSPDGLEVATQPDDTVHIDQQHLRFSPGTVAVTPGTTVTFANSDPILHNVFSPAPAAAIGFDLGTYPLGDSRPHTFDSPGAHVILCHVHPEMVAYVVVVPTRWKGVARADGSFSIDDVPPGDYRLHAWHPRARGGVVTDVVVGRRGAEGVVVELLPPRRTN